MSTASTSSAVLNTQQGTESVRRDLAGLDEFTPLELARTMIAAESRLPAVLAAAEAGLEQAIVTGEACLRAGGRLIYVGSGTSGRLAAQDAAECLPTFGVPPSVVIALLAGGPSALHRAVEGAEDDVEAAKNDLAAVSPTPKDCVVGVSASGRTPYVLAALELARELGCGTIAVVNNSDSPIAKVADVRVELSTGAEVVAGSTRLTAGTAQKVALNILSTGVMIRLGKTLGPWMVDLQPSNRKLRHRAVSIVMGVAGVQEEEARQTLEEAEWHTAVAVLMILCQAPREVAQQSLDEHDGHVRHALDALRESRGLADDTL